MPPVLDPYAPVVPYSKLPDGPLKTTGEWYRVPSDFWGSPVLKSKSTGELTCPGFTGNTYSKRIDDYVTITVPFGTHKFPKEPQTPGICEVTAGKERKYDLKKPQGSDGARFTATGIMAAIVQIKITIWTPQQFEELKKLWQVLFPGETKTLGSPGNGSNKTSTTNTAGATDRKLLRAFRTGLDGTANAGSPPAKTVNVPQPFDVSHPVLDMHKIRSLIFVKGEGPMPGGFKNARVFVMTGVEFLPPGTVDATLTPQGAVRAIGSTLEPAPTPPGQNPDNTGPT